jgi:hypothetical protein
MSAGIKRVDWPFGAVSLTKLAVAMRHSSHGGEFGERVDNARRQIKLIATQDRLSGRRPARLAFRPDGRGAGGRI